MYYGLFYYFVVAASNPSDYHLCNEYDLKPIASLKSILSISAKFLARRYLCFLLQEMFINDVLTFFGGWGPGG